MLLFILLLVNGWNALCLLWLIAERRGWFDEEEEVEHLVGFKFTPPTEPEEDE